MNLLGAKLYDPAGAVTKACTSNIAMVALDTTNLRLTVTVPAHGMIRVKMQCAIDGAATYPQILLGVMENSTVRGRIAPHIAVGGTALATTRAVAVAEFTIAGLTPGSTVFDAAYGVEFLVASSNIRYGGPNNTTASDAWGGFLFEIWDPQPLPTVAPGAANGLQICGSNAATTYASLTSTGAFTVNGVAATSQTGDNFARLGAPAGASVSADIAAAKADTAAVKAKTDNLPAAPASTTNITAGIITTTTNLTNLPAITTNWLTAAGIASGALNGKGDWNIGKTGYALSSAAIQAIWDALTSALTTVGSIGKKLADWTIGTAQTGDSFARLGTPIGASISADVAAVKSDSAAIKTKTDNLPASPAAVGSAMTLTSGERTAIANEVEIQIIDEADAEKVLTAITDKIAAVNPDLGGLTVGAIASGVRSNLATELGRIDVAISSRGVALDAAGIRGAVGIASANLDTQLDALPTNAEMSSALGAADDAVLAAIAALNNLSQANIRTAVGLATANLDTQLDALPTNSELTAALAVTDDATLAAVAALNNLSPAEAQTAAAAALAAYDPPTRAEAVGDRDEVLTAVADLPTNAEMVTALAGSDDAVLAQVALVKTKTDQLTFTKANEIDANIQSVNGATVTGDGQPGTEWGS